MSISGHKESSYETKNIVVFITGLNGNSVNFVNLTENREQISDPEPRTSLGYLGSGTVVL